MPFSTRLTPLAVPALTMAVTLFAPHSAKAAADLPGTEEQIVAQLETRAAQASVKDQCFLYTELVQRMTELAGHQLLAGDSDRANATLKQVAHYADLIHLGLSKDTKRLKNAEQVMQQTTFRMSSYLRAASGDDRTNIQLALKQLNHVEQELMTEVFKH